VPLQIDTEAEAVRLAELKVEAALRPPRTGCPPRNQYNTMTQTTTLETIERVITGELLPAPADNPPPPRNYEESAQRLGHMGLDEVLALVEEGHSTREICARIGTRPAHLTRWIGSTEGADSRVRASRTKAAQAWLDRGLAALEDADSAIGLAKAREIAQICRKYASVYDTAFSDRVQVDTTIKAEDPGSIDAKLRLLVQQVAQKAVKEEEKPQ
jgi:hypothetical protein